MAAEAAFFFVVLIAVYFCNRWLRGTKASSQQRADDSRAHAFSHRERSKTVYF